MMLGEEPKSSHHEKKSFFSFPFIVSIRDDGWRLNLLLSFHSVCKSDHRAVLYLQGDVCRSVTKKTGERGRERD